MKKIFLFFVLFLSLFHINAYGVEQKKPRHYDKANITDRTNAENFKDYALMTCLQFADEKAHRPINKDLSWSIRGYLQNSIDFDLDNIKKTEYTLNEIVRLSKKYIDHAGGIQDVPEGTAYIRGCIDFFHSDELNKLMKNFVLRPNQNHRQTYPIGKIVY